MFITKSRSPQLDRPDTWEDDIKLDLQEIRWKGVNWIFVGQDRV
jgi:hypothetical protein